MNKKEPLKIVHLFTLMYIDDMHTYKIWIYIFLYMIYIYTLHMHTLIKKGIELKELAAVSLLNLLGN